MTNPCFCGCSLKTGSVIFAFVDIILSALCSIIVIGFGVFVIVGIAISPGHEKNRKTNDEDDPFRQANLPLYGLAIGFIIVLIILMALSFLITFGLGFVLKSGADANDPNKLRIWLVGSLSNLAYSSIVYFFFFNLLIIVLLPGLIYRLYALWVVYEFRNEMRPTTTLGVVYSQPPEIQETYALA